MSEYRYVVFPHGKQPTVDEAAALQNLSGVLRGRYAVGFSRESGALAIVFEKSVYEQATKSHRGFRSLLQNWQRRGTRVVDRLSFVKDADALQPVVANPWSPSHSVEDRSTRAGKKLAGKQLAAQEAVGRSLLGVQKTLERYAALERLGAVMPYLFIAFGASIILWVGFLVRSQLLEADIPLRREIDQQGVVELLD